MNNKEFQKMINRIKELREENHLTQLEVAKILHINRTVYNRYENGKREPPISFIFDLAKLYQVTIDDLLGLE